MATVTALLELPDAVLVQICSQFCPHCAGEDCLDGFELPERFRGPGYFGTLAALARVNVRMARLVQQVRLHVVCGRRSGWTYCLSRLVRILLEKPELAEHIRVIRLGHRDGDQQFVGCFSPRQVQTMAALGVASAVYGQGYAALAKFEGLEGTEDTLFFRHAQGLLHAYGGDDRCPGSAPFAKEMFPVARFNAFVLLKLARKATAVAMLSEWPFVLFPATKPTPRIQVKGATPQPPTNTVDLGRLPQIVEMRLDTDSPYLGTLGAQSGHGYVETGPRARPAWYKVDLAKVVGLLVRVPNLRILRLRGVDAGPSASAIFAWGRLAVTGSTLANLTTLDLVSINRDALCDIIRCCSPRSLRHVSFQIAHGAEGDARPGDEVKGTTVLALLDEFDLAENLRTLRIDTAHNYLFKDGIRAQSHDDIRDDGFRTVESLRDLASLRHLSLSADNIYFPSLYPRVLLRDKHTDGKSHRDGERLLTLLPSNIETLEITGIYAMHVKDMRMLARACGDDDHYNDEDNWSDDEGDDISDEPYSPMSVDSAIITGTASSSPANARSSTDAVEYHDNNNSDSDMDIESPSSSSFDQRPHIRFPNLKRVILRAGGITDSLHRTPWPFPGEDPDNDTLSEVTRAQWENLADNAKAQGAEYDSAIKKLFAARGVEYEFDEPEFYFAEYTADYTESPWDYHS
ncbi:uncharacterized protein B0T15DRAFT_572014 [Chaetomium strumarium]|uniref:Uncharacterized protein n=1 Tax=Chaetomium strumarium TaxID=1170767 RepID=A0AAJ0H4J5_9PEZI|nr:hypothetical protein B0T15DRAFT_572014 [Chaetomium strumarium]